MFDLFREISQTIRNNKLRTSLTGLAVVWGIFMLIVLLGAARGVINSFEEESSNSSVNNIEMWNGQTSLPYKGYRDGRTIRMRDKDMKLIQDEVKTVTEASASASASGFNIVGPKDYVSGGFRAVYPDVERSDRINITKGRFVNDRDLSELEKA